MDISEERATSILRVARSCEKYVRHLATKIHDATSSNADIFTVTAERNSSQTFTTDVTVWRLTGCCVIHVTGTTSLTNRPKEFYEDEYEHF